MKAAAAAALALLAALSVRAQDAADQQAAAQRARIDAERAAVEARFAEQKKACNARFAVTDCIEKAARERNAVIGELRQQ
jgi:hypothetical protein